MKKLAALFLALSFVFTAGSAEARAVVIVGGGFYGPPAYYYPGYPGYYPAYPAYYTAPPPVIYAPAPVVAPPVSAPVVYGQQPMTTPTAAADQTSPTFIDSAGRTCRHYQLTNGAGPAFGTACLMADGTWQTVQ